MSKVKWLAVCLGYVGLATLCHADDFSIHVENNQLPGKTLYIAVYSQELGGWDATPTLKLQHTLAQEEELSLPLSVPAGHYAIRAFIDLDDDKTMKTGFAGRPQEPFASSIGDGRSKPAILFSRSTFELSAESPDVAITLRYPKGTLPPAQ